MKTRSRLCASSLQEFHTLSDPPGVAFLYKRTPMYDSRNQSADGRGNACAHEPRPCSRRAASLIDNRRRCAHRILARKGSGPLRTPFSCDPAAPPTHSLTQKRPTGTRHGRADRGGRQRTTSFSLHRAARPQLRGCFEACLAACGPADDAQPGATPSPCRRSLASALDSGRAIDQSELRPVPADPLLVPRWCRAGLSKVNVCVGAPGGATRDFPRRRSRV